jgi:hypothetical protein
VDARLKEIAGTSPGPAVWKDLVGKLSDATPDAERIQTYQAVREAGVLPEDAAFFLFGHGIQWMLPEVGPEPPEDEEGDKDDDLLDRHTVASLRRFGLDDLAELYASNRLEYDRRHERGRQFFFGPPDEELAAHLRERGVID